MRVVHNIPPVYDGRSRILLLGSFPSVRSREGEFFYHHPQNRFWRVLAAVLGVPVPQSVAEKREMLLRGGVALWDVAASCEIEGSGDASIRNVQPNDIGRLLREAPIAAIFCNGAAAHTLYRRYLEPRTGIAAQKLPSTSPANAAWSLERLTEAWRAALTSVPEMNLKSAPPAGEEREIQNGTALEG